MEIKMPLEVQRAIDMLSKNNFEAYIVGGCVRDSIMGKSPADWILQLLQPLMKYALFFLTIKPF